MIKNNLWKINNYEKNEVDELIKELGITDLLAITLINRGYKTEDKIKRFLRPDIKHLHSPLLLKDMKKAVDRIIDEITNGGKIIIYGDYDVDGVTSTAILFDFLKNIGANVLFYIPDRFEDGYGLNLNVLKKLCESKPALFITVDCGISGFAEVEYVNEQKNRYYYYRSS